MKYIVPVIDLFAGPGGLSEGFSAVTTDDDKPFFKVALSVEKDIYAYKTLRLRAFYRLCLEEGVPEEYYSFMKGKITWEELFSTDDNKYYFHKRMSAKQAWLATLGSSLAIDEELDIRIREIRKKSDRWILIGGPPCQAYSIIGRVINSRNRNYNPEEDERTHLYKEYLKILAKHKPAIFLMENVKGILSSKLNGERIIDKIIQDLERPSSIYTEHGEVSYRIFSLVKNEECEEGSSTIKLKPTDFVIECEKYGIPQKRHRLILLGIREDLYRPPRPQTLIEGKRYKVKDIIERLPRLRSGLSREDDNAETWIKRVKEGLCQPWFEDVKKVAGNEVHNNIFKTINRLSSPKNDRGGEFIPFTPTFSDDFLSEWYIDERLGGVCNHHSKAHMTEDIYRYLYVSSFGSYYQKSPHLDDFPNGLLPNHQNVKTGKFTDRFRVQLWDQPSTTITSHLEKDGHYFIHPDSSQCRSITVREAARLQTFPDNYYFCGGKRQQYKQVGNAVPPLLAKSIAEIIRHYLVGS